MVEPKGADSLVDDDAVATAFEIDVALVRRLVEGQFPEWADHSIRAVEFDGWDNRTLHLGDEMSVRLPSRGCYAGQVEKEHTWLARLAALLPLPIPVSVAMGVPGCGYPWRWSIRKWIEGESAAVGRIDDLSEFAESLAGFLVALHAVDSMGGPGAGAHNFFRGGPLTTYDRETREALASLEGRVDTDAAGALWEAALEAVWDGGPVAGWLHGDVSAGNLLVHEGRLSAVIDFGCCGVGDPACDLTIAWTLFVGESREVFGKTMAADDAIWLRARGWALWKALITLREHIDTDQARAAEARRVFEEVLGDGRVF